MAASARIVLVFIIIYVMDFKLRDRDEEYERLRRLPRGTANCSCY